MNRVISLLALCFCLTPVSSAQNMKTNPARETCLFDFTQASKATWQVDNDDVMGGVSTSTFHITNGVAVFCGELSLENNGGFASVRTLLAQSDLGNASEFVLRVRGDGRRYKFTARTDSSFDGPLYQSSFTTTKGEWQEVRLPLKDFAPSFRGQVLNGEPPISARKLTSIGFLISDKQAGRFELEIAWIKAAR